ncbi:MAG TPA: fused response regulator/phosphatase [Polyangiaceae bacterium]|nr:fused response regulator/phosphatase [Polyangiaceae bacterium]
MSAAPARTERIVVVDDSKQVQEAIARQLGRLGFTTIRAGDGNKGLEVIREHAPELVLCDLRMPNVDGLELLATVRREFPDMPFVVMSGEGLVADAVGALKLGAWDYIEKPIEFAALEHAIQKALERAALIEQNRRYRNELEALNLELRTSLKLLADDEEAGRQIQFRMLPKNDLRFGHYRVTRELVPSRFLSGDFIDAFRIDAGHFGFYLADVAGHGVASALVTVLLRTFVQRELARYEHGGEASILSPGHLLMRLNDDLAKDDLGKHLTIFFGVVEQARDVLAYATAGHFPWPILYDGQTATALEHASTPAGMLPGARYAEHRKQLRPGACLSIFSDGLLDALGEKPLRDKLAFVREYFGRPDVNIENARRELGFSSPFELPDDVAVLIIQRGTDDARA